MIESIAVLVGVIDSNGRDSFKDDGGLSTISILLAALLGTAMRYAMGRACFVWLSG